MENGKCGARFFQRPQTTLLDNVRSKQRRANAVGAHDGQQDLGVVQVGEHHLELEAVDTRCRAAAFLADAVLDLAPAAVQVLLVSQHQHVVGNVVSIHERVHHDGHTT